MVDPKIAFIGGGNMATAIIGGLISNGASAQSILVSEPDQARAGALVSEFGIKTTADNGQAVDFADVVVFAVKPQIMSDVLSQVENQDWQGKLALSIAAGITTDTFQKSLGESVPVVRCMPNTPALVKKGASALFATNNVSDQQREISSNILSAVGVALWLEQESQIDAVTALSGSGPAYFFLILESLEAAAIELGLTEEVASTLARQTMEGAACLAQASDVGLVELRNRVTSKGGTTAKGVEAMELGNIREVMKNTVTAAWQRSIELSKS